MRTVARLVAVSLLASLLWPAFLCGLAPDPQDRASDCCRAMRFACHEQKVNRVCCNQPVSTPSLVAVAAQARRPLNPLASLTGAFLSPVKTTLLALRSVCLSSTSLHPPPGNVSLFLLHSVLLI